MFLLDPLWGWNINFESTFWRWLARFQASLRSRTASLGSWVSPERVRRTSLGLSSSALTRCCFAHGAQLENAVTEITYEVRVCELTTGAAGSGHASNLFWVSSDVAATAAEVAQSDRPNSPVNCFPSAAPRTLLPDDPCSIPAAVGRNLLRARPDALRDDRDQRVHRAVIQDRQLSICRPCDVRLPMTTHSHRVPSHLLCSGLPL